MAQFNDSLITGEKVAASGTYSEDEIVMPKTSKNQIPAIIGIDILHMKMNTLANKYSKWHLSIKSNDDIIDLSSRDCIDMDIKESATNAAPVTTETEVQRIVYPAPIPITSSKLFIGFKQDSGSSHTYQYRLHIVPRYIPGMVQQDNLNQQVQF